jgi:2-methylaconitate cis-trans-isomerase PrpF
MDPRDSAAVQSASLLRTARMIMRGEVCIPGDLW